MKLSSIIVLFFLLVSTIVSLSIYDYFSHKKEEKHENIIQNQHIVRGMFFGDFNFSDRWYDEMVSRNKATAQWLLEPLKTLNLHQYDFVSANLESSVYKTSQDCQYSEKQNIIKTKEKYLPYFKDIGITHVSLANNHSYDCGNIWFQATKKYLDEQEIKYFWEWRWNETNVLLEEINGKKIAFIWLNDTTYRVDWDKKYEMISQLDQQWYFVIINIHWGSEYKTHNNQRQKSLAQNFINNWADFIIWHHPHVIQNYEVIDGVPVYYSLGNFFFDQPMQPTLKGMWVSFILDNNVIETQPIYFHRDPKFMNITHFSND